MIPRSRYPFVIALSLALTYALVTRFVAAAHVSGSDMFGGGLLSIAFVVVMPLALGAITAHFIPADAVSRGERLAWAPLLSVLLFLVSALLFQLEGLICVFIISPLYLLLSWLGAFGYASLTDASRERRNKVPVLAAFVLLPYLVGPAERLFAAPDSIRLVENHIDIAAPAPVVWRHIIRVAPINRRALGHSPIDILGFPHPVEATLSHEGVGGVRHATFERGVEFIETVDDWQPLRRLSFSIVPNTATIPPTTFDEHVTVGGQYFDVLRGTYELQPLGPGHTRLVLVSEQRLSTHLNWYAGLWTRYIMSEIQARILGVLKQRCEAAAPTAVAAARP